MHNIKKNINFAYDYQTHLTMQYKLDETDQQILDILIENARIPYTDIAKNLNISAGTVHVRIKKMEESGLLKGTSLNLDYDSLEYNFVLYVGIFLEKNHQTQFVIERIYEIPFVTMASVVSGKFNIFCKIRAKNQKHAKEIIYQINDIQGVTRTETMIALEENFNDKKRLLHTVTRELN